MKKFLYIVLGLFILASVFSQNVFAEAKAAGSSAKIQIPLVYRGGDNRVKILQGFLEKNNSPLAPYAEVFVKNADLYNLDWKFVAAISGVESTFGQQIPTGSYNAWGWGIYGNNTFGFESWPVAIETISRGLREKYINKWGAQNIYQIGSIYAASPTWAARVEYFMEKINDYSLKNPGDALSLSL